MPSGLRLAWARERTKVPGILSLSLSTEKSGRFIPTAGVARVAGQKVIMCPHDIVQRYEIARVRVPSFFPAALRYGHFVRPSLINIT